MPSHLNAYLNLIKNKNGADMASSISDTATNFTDDYLNQFSFYGHETGLLLGDVQAGKTSQTLGIVCAAADSSFPLFVILTTDSVALQSQTYERVSRDLEGCDFCICGETDRQKFIDNQLRKPAIVVLKKNSKVLLQWYNTFASSSFVRGNALFIVDDEADAASPNTLVNKNRTSIINTRLTNIRDASIGSIYLQVTGTPQALLLQSTVSDFRPNFTYYFEPGEGYLGGEFFFGEDKSHIFFIDDINDTVKDGVYYALIHHLVASAQLFLSNNNVCNFVIHPGVRKAQHNQSVKEVTEKIQYLSNKINEQNIRDDIQQALELIDPQKSSKQSFEKIYQTVKELLEPGKIKILVMNADTNITDDMYKTGSNIIIGGNVLGRGITFPKLQTLYYTRTAKKPQADTIWQHSRMFGYDRDPGMMAVYLTKELYKLFSDINAGNNSIISQVKRGIDNIQLFYPEGINPTRKNVIDMKMVDFIGGGTNYYPNNPENDSVEELNQLLQAFDANGYYQVSLKLITQILTHVIPSEDFNLNGFIDVLNAIMASNPNEQGIMIVRRNRAVTQGTGSLLSPNDRALGDNFIDKVVLTLYQIEGEMGWKQPDIWVPNIKLPEFYNYYNAR